MTEPFAAYRDEIRAHEESLTEPRNLYERTIRGQRKWVVIASFRDHWGNDLAMTLDTYRGWGLYRMSFPCWGRKFNSRAEAKRAVARVLRMPGVTDAMAITVRTRI